VIVINTYCLYGLNIKSRWPLPGVKAIKSGPAVVELLEGTADLFGKAKADVALRPDAAAWYENGFLKDGSIYLHWPGLFEFLISPDGSRIAARFLGDTHWEAFQAYLLGQVLSFALIKQGIEPIHCTVMVIDGRAIGLLGDCGYGKSTLAAAFLQAGHSLLTDDLLVLKENGRGFLAYPSFPRIKLFPEIAAALLGDKINGTPMNPFTQKLIIPLGQEQICHISMPLQAFFVIRPPKPGLQGKRVTIRTISKRRACLGLIANTFNAKVTEPDRQTRLLAWASRLANRIPVKSLSYPRDLARLPEVVAAIKRSLDK
jgi:hypothetical protein